MIIPRPAVDKQAVMIQLVRRGTVTCGLRFKQAKKNTEITTINPPQILPSGQHSTGTQLTASTIKNLLHQDTSNRVVKTLNMQTCRVQCGFTPKASK